MLQHIIKTNLKIFFDVYSFVSQQEVFCYRLTPNLNNTGSYNFFFFLFSETTNFGKNNIMMQ